jgi:hypothetical protein
MRINLLAMATLLLTTFSFAGTPAEDPVVKERRERFIQARIPTLEDIKLGKTWQCIAYDSMPGSFDILGPADSFRFLEFDGIVTNEIKFQYRKHEFHLTPKYFTDSVTMRLPKDNYEAVNAVVYIRVSVNGDLIFENTFDDDIPVLNGSPRSVSDKTKLATQYGVCPTNTIRD